MRSRRKQSTPKDERLRQTLWFLIKLLALSVPLYLVIWLAVDLYPLQEVASSELQAALQMLGYTVQRDGAMMTVEGGPPYPFTFYIVEDCTAWKSMLFLIALIVAVPKIRWQRRLVGVAIGLPLLWIGNLLRNISVVLIERGYGLEMAMIAHDWLWKAGLMAMVMAIWLAWWKWAQQGNLSVLAKSKVWRSITRSRS
ncbi:MAG: exosortase/archaeosortase family protein [Candidatus Aenigmatarchaeota archaeon]